MLSIDAKDEPLEVTRKSGQRAKENDGCKHVRDSFLCKAVATCSI